MVHLNNFSVNIIPRNGISDEFNRFDSWYVSLDNGTEYILELTNDRNTLADVDVTIDGRYAGSWRLEANSTITLERPARMAKRFTFFNDTSPEAQQAGVHVGSEENGLIEVTFKPKKRINYTRIQSPRVVSLRSESARIASDQYQSGVTLLGNSSSQRFGQVEALRPDQIDTDNITTISLRLVARLRVRRTSYPPPMY